MRALTYYDEIIVASSGIMPVPSFMKISKLIQKLFGSWWQHISFFLFKIRDSNFMFRYNWKCVGKQHDSVWASGVTVDSNIYRCADIHLSNSQCVQSAMRCVFFFSFLQWKVRDFFSCSRLTSSELWRSLLVWTVSWLFVSGWSR
jgi:hypothetical protein